MKWMKMSRQAVWLLPGIAIKRWLGLLTLGGFSIVLGVALLLNLQPVTATIELLKALAQWFPSNISGPLLIGAGALSLIIGVKRLYATLLTASDRGRSVSDILETLYRRNKLDHGPKILAIGGGTGLSTLLRGLKHYTNNITAVVTVGDDGGSSGRLRQEQGIIPPGDIRNCIAALADEEKLITELFQYRFRSGSGLEGHSFGNLFLTAMCRITGDMMTAIKESSKVLNIRGRVLPSSLDNIQLVADMEDGSEVRGESNIPEARGKIVRLRCEPEHPKPLDGVVEAIEEAELIVLGPGSLYTSVVPNLLITEITAAIARSQAPKIYIANMMTQPGETDGLSVSQHLEAILAHCDFQPVLDCVFVNQGLPEELLAKYLKANCTPVHLDLEACHHLGITVVQRSLVDTNDTNTIRHHPKKLARAVIMWFKRQRKMPLDKATQRIQTTKALRVNANAPAATLSNADGNDATATVS
ncbi:MAG: YvcK family protein [Candidatus Melainabacteria bacterium]|nr:YvcK family protein [Candidatus Melainabacteria bacterium]